VFGYEPKGQGFESLTARHQKALKTLSFQGFLLFSFCCYTTFRGCTTYGGMSAYYQSLLYAIRQYHAQFNDYLDLKQ
jgi:hypothetical protein